MVEKPFGYDLASATELIARLTRHFHEDQIYRIDHYLAKETAQNLLVFRSANPVFGAVWNRHHTKAITITSSETIGIEGRAAFYDPVGALRDVVQNHLLQLLALVMMEPPAGRTPAALHAAKLRLLEDIVPVAPDEVSTLATRGQYMGYRDDAGNQDSITETFARLRLNVANDRWRGVPVTIQNGKALDRKTTEIEFTFADEGLPEAGANRLVFRLQPDEGISIDLLAKRPGFAGQTEKVSMDFAYASSFAAHVQPTAYERVLLDGLRGDQSLFASSAEILASWKIIDSVVAEWSKSASGLQLYDPGSAPLSIGRQPRSAK
jgi:glucose-6-phosphate 1-dehydrogenase